MKDDAAAARAPRVWLDVTTSYRARGAQANGTLRVERSYATALAPLLGDRLRFCRYDRARHRFLPLAAMPAGAAAPSGGRPDRPLGASKASASPGVLAAGRRIERAIREWRRGMVGAVARRLEGDRPPLDGASPCEILLMVGENWAHHDFAAIRDLRRRQGVRIAALCQDLIPEVCPQFFDGGDFVSRYRDYATFLARDVDLVIAISKATAADVSAFAQRHGGMAGGLATVQLGADFGVAGEPRQPASHPALEPGRFVLSVSTIQSRKNFDLLYHLWQRLSAENVPNLPRLVIVGRRGFGSNDLLWQIANDPLVRESILVLHGATDAELAWLYRRCLFTLYPSFYEGWGLPISESLAHGKFCIASNTSSLPEAGQGLVQHIDPLDFAAWRAAVMALIASPGALQDHEARIAREFTPMTWAQSAAQLIEALETMPASPLADSAE